jgi:ethanolamine utilization protein EutM
MKALGLIETKSMVALIEAADTMVKEANVTLLRAEQTGGGQCTAIVRGDEAACRAAVGAGETAARKVGELVTSCVVVNPHAGVQTLFDV